jgi:PAS domain S-box-containing protein
MDKEKTLILKIEMLEQENRELKNLLNGASDEIPGYPENSFLNISGKNINDSLDKEELLNINSAAYQNLSNEKYISNLSRNLNTMVNECEVVKIVLRELAWRSGAETAYYIQLNDSASSIYSLIRNDIDENSPVFSENKISADSLLFDRKELHDTGFSIYTKKNIKNDFFQSNPWIAPTIESLLIFPVIVKNEITGIIALDISGKEQELSAVDLMIYQTVSSIITGSLKRIASENETKLKKDQYELIIENTPHLLFQLIPEGKILFSNKKFSEFLNVNHDDLIGKSIFDFIDIDGIEHLKDAIYSLTLNESSGTIELITNFTGIPRLIKLDFNAVFDSLEKIILINFLGEDITEKKFLENELLKTKKRLDLAFLAANDSYWDADLITGEFFYSQNFYRMLGYDHYNKLEKFSKFLKIVHPDDVAILKDTVKKSLSGEAIRSTVKFRVKTSYDDYMWILSRTMVIETNESGKPSRIIGTNSDITETVRIHDKLKESENRLKLILDNMPVMLDAMDRDNNIIHWNRECERVTGYAKDEIINNPEAPEFLCRDDEEIRCTYEQRLELGGNYRNKEFDLTCKDGKRKTIMWSNLSDLYPVPGWHSWSVGIDITELKEVSKALDLSREKIMEAQIIAKLGYWEYNHHNKIGVWDSILSEIMGYNSEYMEFNQQELFSHIHEEDRESAISKFVLSVKNRLHHNDIYRCRLKNGETVYLKQISKTEYNSDGKAVLSRGIIFDITELKRTELELVKAKEKAEENNRLKSAFLANMSHEIRTPLNSIIGFSEILSDRTSSPEESIMYVDIIRESSKQLTSLVSDIIDISKIDANLMDIEKKGFTLNKKIEHLYEIFRNELKTKNKSIKLSAQTALNNNNDLIVSDEIRLTQILSNLLGNAIKFTEQGTIDFGYTLTEDNKYIEFYVSDTGIGIQKKNHKKIFGRFQQADPSITRKYGGTGLGLSISKELSRLLGGKMWLRSEPGKGSAFYFKIPYVQAEHSQIMPEIIDLDDKKYSRLKNKIILIVDDNATVVKLLTAILQKFSIICLTADSGKAALDIVKSDQKLDLILLDIQMPDMDGVTVLNFIKEINPSIKVIAQTANAFEEDRKKYIQIGFNGYVSKPFNRSEIIKTINSLI